LNLKMVGECKVSQAGLAAGELLGRAQQYRGIDLKRLGDLSDGPQGGALTKHGKSKAR
jgi:hypothetical protein